MLNLKKVIASICVLAMVLSTVAFGATYTDVAEDSAYYEAVETLNKLGIIEGYEDGTFRPEDGVTRAEMAALIARIQGYGDTALGAANTDFTDVPSSHWASGYVSNAAGLGIINGYGNGTFGPDEPVLYEQAIKMIMATLGYTPFANENGGYPAGYLAAATRYNVTAKVSGGTVGQPANRGTIAQLLVNAIDTPLMVQYKWNTNGEVEYIIAEGEWNDKKFRTEGYKTLMSENLGIVKLRGVVVETPFIDLDADKDIDTTKEEEIAINVYDDYGTENDDYIDLYGVISSEAGYEGEYFVAGTDAADYFGRSVIAYVKASEISSDEYEIASIAIDTSRNTDLTMALDQFDNVAGKDLEYYKEGANKKTVVKLEEVAGSTPLVFNNAGGYTVANLNTLVGDSCLYGGQITLVDNDSTKGYDIAFCDLAATAVVKKVTSNGIALHAPAHIGGKTPTSTIYVYPEDETKVVTIYKDGEVIEYTDLNEWDILSVYGESSRADIIVAEVLSNEVVGTIGATKSSKTSADDEGLAYKVGDDWYDVAEGCYNEGMEAGAGGKFYIDEFGKIAAFIEDSALAGGLTGNYGYVIAVKPAEADFGTAGGCVVKVQLLTADGVEVVEIKNNAKFYTSGDADVTLKIGDWTYTETVIADDEETPDVNEARVDVTIGNDDGHFAVVEGIQDTVIKYTKDANGKLASIREVGYNKNDADPDFESASIAGVQEYDEEALKLGRDIDAEAVVFVVGDNADECAVVSAADLVDKAEYNVLASYKTKKADDADMLVITFDSFNGVSAASNVAVVSALSTTTDDDGLTVFAIDYFQNGEAKYALTSADMYDAYQDDLTVGDVIKVKTTGEVITFIDFVFNFSETVRSNNVNTASAPTVAIATADAGSEEEFVGGKVTGYNDKGDRVTIGEGEAAEEYRLAKGVNFYEIDVNARELEVTAEGGSTFVSLSELLYDDTTTTVDIFNNKGKLLKDDIDVDTVQAKYADYVYIRLYEDDIIDVIVVKGYDVMVGDSTAYEEPAPEEDPEEDEEEVEVEA